MIVKVYTDVGKTRPIALYAKVVEKMKKGKYKIQYLSPTTEVYEGKVLYRYENDIYDVEDDSIMEYIKHDEDYIGYTAIDDIGFIKQDSDSDYQESESESSESIEESVVDSAEEDFEVDDYEENDD
jgi:hypothetical protein